MEYKRLTDKDITKVCFDTWELCGLDNVCKRDCREPEPCKIPQIIHRLAELEDKIENGTLVELPCKVGDIIYNKNVKFYLNHKEIPFEKLSELPQMTTDRENHTITEIVLHYIDKDAIFFYTKTEHYTVADGADPEKPTFEGDGYDDSGNIIYDTWICPCCQDRYEVDCERHNHCPTCSQTIDWSDI